MVHIRWKVTSLADQQKTRGAIRINCPGCGAKDAPIADVWLREETAQLVIKHTTYWVKCGACGAVLLSSDPVDALFNRTPSQLEGVLKVYRSTVSRVLVLIACMTFFMPLLGLMSTVPALIATWRVKTGWRTAARVAFVLAIVAHIGLAVLFAVVDDSKGVYRR